MGTWGHHNAEMGTCGRSDMLVRLGPGEKGQTKKNRGLELRYMFLGQIFAKNAKNEPKTLFEASKSVKKQNLENHGKVPK